MGFWDGTATDWGTAVGTVGLALITTVSVIREGKERRELRAERDAARARTDELEAQEASRARVAAEDATAYRRRIYAEGVSCFIDVLNDGTPDVPTATSGRPMFRRFAPTDGAFVRNLSNAAIRNVEVYWQDGRTKAPDGDSALVPEDLISVVPPLGVQTLDRPTALSVTDWPRLTLALLVKFTDINGNRWAVRHDGRLYEVTDGNSLGDLVRRDRTSES